MANQFKDLGRAASILVLSCSLAACASLRRNDLHDEDPISAKDREIVELKGRLEQMSARVDALENRVNQTSPKNNPRAKSTAVLAHPAENTGETVNALTATNDPEAGFINDEPIRAYRRATILLESGKLPEAALAFSSFVERYPDHALAGSAQYYVGESFFRQHDYKQALNEYQRVTVSYDRSSHVSHALARIAQIEESLKMSRESARHRQLLTSLFPHSPANELSEPSASPISNEPAQSAPEAERVGSAGLGAAFDPPPTAPIDAPASAAAPAPKLASPLDSPEGELEQ